MIVVLIIMLAAMFLSWLGFCQPQEGGTNLKVALASVRTQVLAGGVVALTALMPAVVCGVIARRADCTLVLPMVYGLQAAVCMAMIVTKTRYQVRIWDGWQVRMQGLVVQSGMV